MTADEFEKEALSLRPALTAMAARWLGGTDCAEDLVQDAMLKLWAMCAELRSPMAPLARVLVHNLCIDYLRRHHYTLSIDTTDVPDLSNASADIARLTGGTEAAVRKALSRARMAVKEQYLHNM